MLYPIHVEVGDEKHAHGVVVPDFPGCFSAADEWEDLPRMVQEAVEVWIEDEDIAIPKPTPLEALMHDPEHQEEEGVWVWMLVDIDLERLRPKRARRVNITLTDDVLATIDAAAKRDGETRSGYIAKLALRVSSPAAAPATKPTKKKRGRLLKPR